MKTNSQIRTQRHSENSSLQYGQLVFIERKRPKKEVRDKKWISHLEVIFLVRSKAEATSLSC
jgi:hypothetical protein